MAEQFRRKNEKICEGCGARLKAKEKAHETVTRYVRGNMRFGRYSGGEKIEVCLLVSDHPSTKLGTLSVEEWEQVQARKKKPKPKIDPAKEQETRDHFFKLAQQGLDSKKREAIASQKADAKLAAEEAEI
jgi:hypothetical protein